MLGSWLIALRIKGTWTVNGKIVIKNANDKINNIKHVNDINATAAVTDTPYPFVTYEHLFV